MVIKGMTFKSHTCIYKAGNISDLNDQTLTLAKRKPLIVLIEKRKFSLTLLPFSQKCNFNCQQLAEHKIRPITLS